MRRTEKDPWTRKIRWLASFLSCNIIKSHFNEEILNKLSEESFIFQTLVLFKETLELNDLYLKKKISYQVSAKRTSYKIVTCTKTTINKLRINIRISVWFICRRGRMCSRILRLGVSRRSIVFSNRVTQPPPRGPTFFHEIEVAAEETQMLEESWSGNAIRRGSVSLLFCWSDVARRAAQYFNCWNAEATRFFGDTGSLGRTPRSGSNWSDLVSRYVSSYCPLKNDPPQNYYSMKRGIRVILV